MGLPLMCSWQRGAVHVCQQVLPYSIHTTLQQYVLVMSTDRAVLWLVDFLRFRRCTIVSSGFCHSFLYCTCHSTVDPQKMDFAVEYRASG
jgi:hypothetical protein